MGRKKYFVIIFFCLVLIFDTIKPTYGFDNNFAREIIVNIAQRILILKEGDNLKEYPIAVGKSATPTPLGEYNVINKAVNPYYKKLDIKGGSEENPLGSRWISFKYHYGIHGNNDPDSIGTYASGGCIRMHERDVQEIYSASSVGTPVKVFYDPIDISYDINGDNPIIKAQRDYYKNIKNYDELIIEKLKNLKIYSKIEKERLEQLLDKLKKHETVFSDSWCLFINKKYISKDIIEKDQEYYVKKADIEKFFNIDIYSLEKTDYAKLLGSKVGQIITNDIKYIKIKDLHSVLKGSLVINDTEKNICLDSNLLKINKKLFSNVINLTTEPKAPLYRLNKIFDLNYNFKDDTVNLFDKDEDISYILYDNQPYVDLTELSEITNCTVDVSTYNKTVNINIYPEIIFDDMSYEGRIINNEFYIPLHLFLENTSDNNYIYYLSLLVKDKDKYLYKENDVEYIALSHVKCFFDIEWNDYKMKLFLKRRK
ncbi:L,D-transpeptidase [Abyssisolibacter fermentans]|uniref:L,D-transpeptidase n=1 Tax=Abyssisolibacter fermentans TaxID=1766203 RepID=UPI00082D337B|nr:L,D-transpeptidase [Abyssisolibacter fermentans]